MTELKFSTELNMAFITRNELTVRIIRQNKLQSHTFQVLICVIIKGENKA